MPAEPIRFYHRYHQRIETEKVFGEGWLRFAYENPAGRFFVWLLARRKFFSWWYGRKMNQKVSALRILPFITAYDIDVDEFAKSAFDYKTFNEFFYRALKPEARPIAPGERAAILPADGRHLVFPNVETTAGYYVKGEHFTLAELFAEDRLPEAERELARTFAGGGMLISRLCPVDSHRFHFPVDGTPGEWRLINGWLYSVSPVALRHNLHYLVQNKRVVTLIDSPVFGRVAQIEVGATNVGSIRQTFVPHRAVVKGAEKGFFAFGGSCVITVFQRGRIEFAQDMIAQSAQHVETYARMGDVLGTAL
ncbi:archaetidylserine decarboxylase [Opitutus terrae]|uniref:phosphatidylserine decarboxylase n=1 Tax=Opitutus terrae (strain DSM 11246 / JCM 15787 / PB90-1) TaxID=452637 RepID=B1ZYM3_OPITP|nr:archaetidylserine decarboxylase [Opitutus terrae]ACB75259.1 phosphatidylserine decarboxylase [Opitutus terrae PB90-1]